VIDLPLLNVGVVSDRLHCVVAFFSYLPDHTRNEGVALVACSNKFVTFFLDKLGALLFFEDVVYKNFLVLRLHSSTTH
jgi:hypothetical protein